MRKIQDYLVEADIDRLIDHYFSKYPIKLSAVPDHLSAEEARAVARRNVETYIERLRGLIIEPSDDGRNYILFSHHSYEEEGLSTSSLVCVEELLTEGVEAKTYSYIMDAQETIMGFYVGENEFTQRHLDELLAEVLYEASFFGFNQEKRQQTIRELDETIKEYENGSGESIDMEDLWAELGLEWEERDETERELYHAVTKAIYEYNEHMKRKELQAVLDRLQGDEEQEHLNGTETISIPVWVVKEVQPKDDYTLTLIFATGEQRIYSTRHLLEKPIYSKLNNLGFFMTAHVEYGTVVWGTDGEVDIAPEHLYECSTPVTEGEVLKS